MYGRRERFRLGWLIFTPGYSDICDRRSIGFGGSAGGGGGGGKVE